MFLHLLHYLNGSGKPLRDWAQELSRECWFKILWQIYIHLSAYVGGACGYNNLYQEGYGTDSTALSVALFNDGTQCGACFEINCDSSQTSNCHEEAGSITVTATNECPSNSEGGWCDPPREHFDLSEPSFTKLADSIIGVIPVNYRRWESDEHLTWVLISTLIDHYLLSFRFLYSIQNSTSPLWHCFDNLLVLKFVGWVTRKRHHKMKDIRT